MRHLSILTMKEKSVLNSLDFIKKKNHSRTDLRASSNSNMSMNSSANMPNKNKINSIAYVFIN